jgi:hypothetical protein
VSIITVKVINEERDDFVIKGLRKNVFVLKCGKDSPFESAFFILRSPLTDFAEGNLLAEAEKIAEGVFVDHAIPLKNKKRTRKKQK